MCHWGLNGGQIKQSRAGCPLFTPDTLMESAHWLAEQRSSISGSRRRIITRLYARWRSGGRDPVEDDAYTGTEGLPLRVDSPGCSGMVAGTGVKCAGSNRVCWSA